MAKLSHISNSPYRDLYCSIEKMRSHGNDPRVMKLATILREELINFEASPYKKNLDFKNNFRIKFLIMLHSEDKAFYKQSNPIKPFLGDIYKALYTNVFSNKKTNFRHLFSSTMKEARRTEDVIERDKDFGLGHRKS